MSASRLNAIMQAALEVLEANLKEGMDLSYIEDTIDPKSITSAEIHEIEARLTGLQPERLVAHLDGGNIQNIWTNKAPLVPVEMYVADTDLEGLDENDDDVVTVELLDSEQEALSVWCQKLGLDGQAADVDGMVDSLREQEGL